MRNTLIITLCSLFFLTTACKKDTVQEPLPAGSVSFHHDKEQDTIQIPLSILANEPLVLDIQAMVAETGFSSDHWINFAVDTTKINAYREQFGDAQLLPSSSYLFYKATTRIPSGSTVSEPAQLNIGQQTKLLEYTTYVLPIVIQSVDGDPDGAGSSQTLYYVFKTGRPLVINKTGWTIESYSSHFNNFVPANLLNNNLTSYWATNITQQMPQWAIINFNRTVTFTGVSYNLPAILNYPNLGGYPTSIMIETSMDGTNWDNKGTYTGTVVSNKETLPIGLTTARFLRFTSLAAVKYSGAYDAVFISDISLIP